MRYFKVYNIAIDIAAYGEKWRGQTNVMRDCMKWQNDEINRDNETKQI